MSLKKDLLCPHCHGRKFWRIEKMQLAIPAQSRAQHVPVAISGTIWRGYDPHGHFEAFTCAECRYTEWYAQGIEELKHDPQNGVHFIDNEPQAGLR
jgi:protein-disulfide isomerase